MKAARFSTISIGVLGVVCLCCSGAALGQPPIVILPPPIAPPLLPPPLPPRPLPPPVPPVPPTIRPVSQVNPPWFVPPHVDGDADFKGHGPRLELRVSLYIKGQAPNEVWAQIELDASETKNDWTRASNWNIPRHERVAVFARPITQIVTPTNLGLNPDGSIRTFVHFDNPQGGGNSINNPCACGLLNAVHFRGDRAGREAGTWTAVKLEFNPILAR